MARIDCNRLPLAEVEHAPEEVREAAQAWHAAQDELRKAQRAVGRLDNGRQGARNRDAVEAAAARRAGKPGTSRKHEQAYDRDLDAAEHEQRVAAALVAHTRTEYQRALDEHADEWREQVDAHAALIDEAWADAIEALQALHADRMAAHARRRFLGSAGGFPAGAARFRPERLADSITGDKLALARLDDPAARWRQRVVAPVAEVLAALQAADEPEVVEPMPAFQVGADLARAFEHSRSVERGFSEEEARGDSLGPVREGYYLPDGRRVAVRIPGGDS